MADLARVHRDADDAVRSASCERDSGGGGGNGGGGSPSRDDQQATIQALSLEVLDLKTCVRGYEERLASLYGTKDCWMWTATPSLLVKRLFCSLILSSPTTKRGTLVLFTMTDYSKKTGLIFLDFITDQGR